MTVAAMLAGQCSPHNPSMVDVLRDCGYGDFCVMGVRTKILSLLPAHNGIDPRGGCRAVADGLHWVGVEVHRKC